MLDRFRSEIRNEPIVLAHHPLCGKYDDHFFIIRGRKVCRGCLTVYPTALIGVMFLWVSGLKDFQTLFTASLILFSINLIRLVVERSKRSNMVFNIILGSCLSLIIMAAVYCPPDVTWLFYPFVILVYLSFMIYRGHRMIARCKHCPEYSLFPGCFTHCCDKKSTH